MQPPQPQNMNASKKNAFGSNLTSALFTRSIYFIAYLLIRLLLLLLFGSPLWQQLFIVRTFALANVQLALATSSAHSNATSITFDFD